MSTDRKWPFELNGGEGRIRPGSVFPSAVLSISGGESGIVIRKAALPFLVAALYEACGLPAPVILGRPEPRDVLVPDPHGGDDVGVTPSPAGHPGNLPGVNLRVGGEPDGYTAVRLVGDEPLRVAVALIDAMREAEAAAPGPAEVEEIAEKISAAMAHHDGAIGGIFRVAAEVAVRHFEDKRREAAK